MAVSEGYSLWIVDFFVIFYSTVFIMSIVGNAWVIVTCYKNLKQRNVPLMWLVANLAASDLLFTLLTILSVISFFWRWVGGDSSCKLHGFFIEATYTSSITTLGLITSQRSKAVTDPFNARMNSWARKQHVKLAIIWFLCLAVCSPLLHIYRVETQENGDIVCVNTTWGNTGRQLYYSLHAAFFFVIPLFLMIRTQTDIHRALRTRAVPVISNSFIQKSNQRHRKVAKTLIALTIAFVICWSPFIITRTLMYFHLASPGIVWRASQLLISLNAALDPILYGYYGENLKSVLKRVLHCKYALKGESNSTKLRANASVWVRENTRRRQNKNITNQNNIMTPV